MKSASPDDEIANTEVGGTEATEPTSAPDLDPAASGSVAGYTLRHVLGAGGMGEIVAAIDRDIGREVAIKRLKTAANDDELVVRFFREAKIQARLDHPAIVPVYEIGTDDRNRPFFTMKRVAGVTLADVLTAGTATQQRMLRAFVDATQAVELAHARGIVHRDLKPANIMLGDYGEVYVLDWGLARNLEEHEPLARASTLTPETGLTEIGALLGTPGYMSPEQMHDASSVGFATDSYALGAILFHILAGEPLHPHGQAIARTLEGVIDRPSARRPDRQVPPELDALCVRALALDPEARPSARVIVEEVQRYLDGDRDVGVRKNLARAALDDVHAHLAANHRDAAIRAAGRALALDPASVEAAELVTRIMLEPPAVPTPGLAAELHAAEAARVVTNARTGLVSLLAGLGLVCIAAYNGVRDWPLYGTFGGVIAVTALAAVSLIRRPARRETLLWAVTVANAVLVAGFSRMFSPLVLAPVAASMIVASLALFPPLARHWIPLVLIILAGWLIPIALEAAHVLPASWAIAGQELVIRPSGLVVGDGYPIILVVTNAIVIAIGGAHAARLAQRNGAYEREILSQRWHYKQLIPNVQPA